MNREIGMALQAWGVGLLVAALVVLPGMTVLGGLFTDPFLETLLPRILAFFGMILPAVLMTFTIGVVVSLPLFLLGLVTALLFRRRIARHPLVFSGLAPLVTVVLVAVVTVLGREPGHRAVLPTVAEGFRVALQGDTWIFALPVAVGSLYFCLSLARLERSGGAADGT